MDILNAFNVDHNINYPAPEMAPFDAYSLNILGVVIEKATNKSVPIVKFAAGGGPDNFVISSSDTRMRSNYTYDSGTGSTTIEVNSKIIDITARRSQLARAFTMCMLIINSALTLGPIYVTLIAVVRKEKVHEGALLLPVTIILTIPALRNLYVGSPPFGIFLGRSSDLSSGSRIDVASRCVWVLFADDDSCAVFHDTVVC